MSYHTIYVPSTNNYGWLQVADTLVALGSALHPSVAESIGVPRINQQATGLNSMGSTGASIFACTNYVCSQHVDKDVGISVTFQLDKISDPEEFNFAFTEWGFYIETIPNTVWLVQSIFSRTSHGPSI